MKIYVGNLSKQVNEEDLRKAFEAFGEVDSLNIIKDKFSGVSKGFAFVEIEAKLKAQEAIQNLNGTELKGTHIVVNEARPKSDKPRGGGKRW
ncbi:MAG: RNA-binding protein [Calditrichia bacterium]